MAKNFIFLIEMKKDSLLAAGLILELKGYKVMVSRKSENPIKKILELEKSDTLVDLLISDVPAPPGKNRIDRHFPEIATNTAENLNYRQYQ
jgi:hypothetical protein